MRLSRKPDSHYRLGVEEAFASPSSKPYLYISRQVDYGRQAGAILFMKQPEKKFHFCNERLRVKIIKKTYFCEEVARMSLKR
ncbi:MAG: hypothetical protein AYP45_15040 [Candidatus Brocadia carolinensis]|uniref:Uncharacterized protein n=1 Tax=Candidatus Brocadia carolinensis TaxID=1004156 RepID=A0A1V4AQI5_9BACT|nr:MAG: hypothetical protein AYP45_15040 [Candidatus Brocadia caroliniensis]